MATVIRPTTPEDGPDLQHIELLAGERFADIGMPEIAGDQPASLDVLTGYAAAGRSWVATGDDGAPIGYVLVDVVDGNAHIEQVSVLPDHQGRGVGRALADRVRAWAAGRRMTAVTLTTFRDVSWNGPLYRHLGFRFLDLDELGPELAAVRDEETAHGLDPTTRVCMRLDLEPPTTGQAVRVARFLTNVLARDQDRRELRTVTVNGRPALAILLRGRLRLLAVLEPGPDDRIGTIRFLLNPAKLAHVRIGIERG